MAGLRCLWAQHRLYSPFWGYLSRDHIIMMSDSTVLMLYKMVCSRVLTGIIMLSEAE